MAVRSRADVAQAGLAQADVTADDGDSGGVMKSVRQQDEVACGGDLGRAGVAIKATESGADVGWLGSELRAEAWSTAGAWALYRRLDKENAQAWMQATRRWRAEAVGGGSEGTGAASCFPGSELQLESRVDVAQADVMIGDGDRGSLMGSKLRQDEVVSEGDNRRPGGACCFLGPELRAGSQAEVAQGSVTADSGAIGGSLGGKRQQGEAVRSDGAGGTGAASGFLGRELRDGSRADVGLPATGTRLLCGLVGTDQPGAKGDEYVGSTDGGRQEGKARGGGFERADAANRFPGSKLQVESRAVVAREDATAGDGVDGGLMVNERQQGGVGHGGDSGGAEAACRFLEPELQIESRAGGSRPAVGARQMCGSTGAGQLKDNGRQAKTKKTSRRVGSMQMVGTGAAEVVGSRADVDRLWSRSDVLRWKREAIAVLRSEERVAREKATRLHGQPKRKKRAAQDQGNKTGPTQAGPCAACARQGGICGFCKERQRLAC